MTFTKAGAGLMLAALMVQSAPVLAQPVDINAQLGSISELNRLRYFREINLAGVLQSGLSGKGVRVTIMGEMVDPDHPDIRDAVVGQYNAFASSREILKGPGNAAFRGELLQPGDGHGTHIAGTIAAACDDLGVAGVACGSTLDVYSIGPYNDTEDFLVDPVANSLPESGFMKSFIRALRDVTRRGESKIVTGSFNLEAPAIPGLAPDQGGEKAISGLMERYADTNVALADLLRDPAFDGLSLEDRDMLLRVSRANGGDMEVPIMSLYSSGRLIRELGEAVQAFQQSGGVYIVTESNYRFGDRTSVLNALPDLVEGVDPGLWLSVVMVQPEGLDEARTAEEVAALKNAPYHAPINNCGTLARDYCIVVPSYNVLSTMTEQVAETALPLYLLDGRTYQAFSGHSMGAPMVAGALALMQEFNVRQNLGLEMRDLVRVLKQTANRQFKGYDPAQHGVGMLDVGAAIGALADLAQVRQ